MDSTLLHAPAAFADEDEFDGLDDDLGGLDEGDLDEGFGGDVEEIEEDEDLSDDFDGDLDEDLGEVAEEDVEAGELDAFDEDDEF